jgi:hypothetical protein
MGLLPIGSIGMVLSLTERLVLVLGSERECRGGPLARQRGRPCNGFAVALRSTLLSRCCEPCPLPPRAPANAHYDQGPV